MTTEKAAPDDKQKKKRWEVLIVDDEKDVHQVTQLAIKRKSWRGRRINLTSAYSAKEAREILSTPDQPSFHVALVDVVMESEHSGLELCDWMRQNSPLSTRIILRTGQPGVAPEDFVLNEYDIDQYLAKTEATPERLYSSLRTSLRSSQDITTLMAIGTQLRQFTNTLQQPDTTTEDLMRVMQGSVAVLEDKHEIDSILFVNNARDVLNGKISDSLQQADVDIAAIANALVSAHKAGKATLRQGQELGLGENTYVMPVKALESVERMNEETKKKGLGKKIGSIFKSMMGIDSTAIERPDPVEGGFFITCPKALAPKGQSYLERDINLFAENWKIAYALFALQETIVQERIAAVEAGQRYGDGAG